MIKKQIKKFNKINYKKYIQIKVNGYFNQNGKKVYKLKKSELKLFENNKPNWLYEATKGYIEWIIEHEK